MELFICIKMDLALNNLQRLICHKTVALWGQAAKADESVLARNQTKDSWTWNLAVSGSGKGTRTRVDDATQREARTTEWAVGHRRAERQAAEVGVEERRGSQHQTPSREARRKIGSSEKSLKMSDPSSIVEFSLVTHASDSPYIYYQECICM